MISISRTLLATILIASLGVTLNAQAPIPSTTDQLRARIAEREHELAALRDQLRLTIPAIPSPVRPWSLTDGAAEAAKIRHEWPLSTKTAPTAASVVAAPPVGASAFAKDEAL